ncbi:MAG: hypothetical protein SVV67_00005, partial [Bacillota bacterium]|nr:hypothetical protein [Bacillota bacterium]
MLNRAAIEKSILIRGRYFSFQDLLEVVETVRMFPRLSRRELALTICFRPDQRARPDGPLQKKGAYKQRHLR